MRWMNIKDIVLGMIIAKDMSVSGLKIEKGRKIDDELMELFKKNNVVWIPVKMKALSEQDIARLEVDEKIGEINRDDFLKVKIKHPDYIKENASIPEEIIDEVENISFDLIHDIRSGRTMDKKEIESTIHNMVSNITFNEKTRCVILEKTKRYDAYTFTHMVNVSVLSTLIAMQLGLDKDQLNSIAQGGLLHDTGKTKIPITIINKRGRLDLEELREIRKHPLYGKELLLESGITDEGILAAVTQHHEKMDGTGYPNGLKDENIHFLAKIAAVADVYDALTTVRSYKVAMTPYKAVSIILSTMKHFDSKVIKGFVDLMGLYPVGTRMELSNGEIATVIETNVSLPMRPIVFLNDKLEIVDLSKASNLSIKRILEDEEETK